MLTGSMLFSIFETVLITLVLMVGVAVGIYVISRKLKTIGALLVAGFLLLAFEPGVKFIVYQFILPNLPRREAMAVVPWYAMTSCVSALVNIAGFVCLLAAIYLAIRPRLQEHKDDTPIKIPHPLEAAQGGDSPAAENDRSDGG